MIKVGETYVLHQDPSGKFDQIVDRWHTLELMRIFSDPPATKVFRGKNLLFPNYPPLPPPRINQIVIPSGATRWASALFLVTKQKMESILEDAATRDDHKCLVEFTADDLGGSSAQAQANERKPFRMWMHPLQPRPLTPPPSGRVDDENQNSAVQDLWLMPFVDRRYWWQFKSVGLMSDEQFGSVSEFVEWLGEKLDATIQLTCLNDRYNKLPDVMSSNDHENAAVVLETLAWHIGCQLVPEAATMASDGITETTGKEFALVSVEESDLILDLNMQGKLGLKPCVRTLNANSETIEIPDNGWEDVGIPQILMGGEYTSSGKQLPESVLLKQKTGGYKEIKAVDLIPVTAETMEKTSATLRLTYVGADTIPDELADRIAEDYYRRFSRLYDYTFTGIQPWQLSAFDDCVVLFQQKYNPIVRESDAFSIGQFGRFRVQTRVRGWPANLVPESPETGTVPADEETVSGEFVCGNCLSCLESDDPENHSDCAHADPSPPSWWLKDPLFGCCSNTAANALEIPHDSGCLWKTEEQECKETFIEESWLDPAEQDIEEDIFHRWELEIDGDFAVLTHKWYRKT